MFWQHRRLKPQGALFIDVSNPNFEEAGGKELRHNQKQAELAEMTRLLGFRITVPNEVDDMLQYLFAKAELRSPKI